MTKTPKWRIMKVLFPIPKIQKVDSR